VDAICACWWRSPRCFLRLILYLAFAAAWLAAAPARAAAVAIVMAIDVSGSVSAESYILQRDGITAAFADARLVDAITAAGGIEALVLEWSDPDKLAVTVDWTHVSDAGSAARFATAVHATTRRSHGLTAIGPALAAAAAQFGRLPQPAARHVIDFSGEGIANLGEPPPQVRDRLISAGITINALAILTEEAWLADYYRDSVIGGPGAFVLTARDFHSFGDAMLRKLTVEITGAGIPLRKADRS
jgi:Ca-activated chloride channel homolog